MRPGPIQSGDTEGPVLGPFLSPDSFHLGTWRAIRSLFFLFSLVTSPQI
jgi:hypothetical protein